MQVVIKSILKSWGSIGTLVVLDLDYFILPGLKFFRSEDCSTICEKAKTPRTQHIVALGHIIEPKTHLRK